MEMTNKNPHQFAIGLPSYRPYGQPKYNPGGLPAYCPFGQPIWAPIGSHGQNGAGPRWAAHLSPTFQLI